MAAAGQLILHVGRDVGDHAARHDAIRLKRLEALGERFGVDVAHVALAEHPASTRDRRDLGGRRDLLRETRLGLEIEENAVAAFFREENSDRSADAGAAAGHESDAVTQAHVASRPGRGRRGSFGRRPS